MINGLSSSFIENSSSTTLAAEEEEILAETEEEEGFADAVEGEKDNTASKGGITSSDDVYEEFQNSRVIEPFSEGTKIQYGKHKLLLKSILAGILFYLLSSPQVYKLTKPYLKNIDAVIIHSLLFVAIHFFLNIVFN
jgi:hypothetical protein